MFNIKFEFEDPDDELTGFNMGHMTLHGDLNTASSKNKKPSQSMMILISIVELLDGLREFITSKNNIYEFVGADSSFFVYFNKISKEMILVSVGSHEITESKASEIIASVYKDVKSFLRDVLPSLPKDDIAYHDLNLSLSEFENFLKERTSSKCK